MKKYLNTYLMLSFACWLIHPTIVDVFVENEPIDRAAYFNGEPVITSLMLGLVFTIIFSFISIRR
tara:strand:- start:147 stop:341 length:195 start_codon:yes stop_codon:yes gene_type:complete